MKIDHEYLRQILEAFEAAEHSTTDLGELERNGLPHDEEHLDKLVLHMEILQDQRMIESLFSEGIGFARAMDGEIVVSHIPLRLTASGHAFLGDIRQEGVWETVKDKLQDASIDTIASVAKKLALAVAMKLIA